ncbi:hypothetical protein TVAGG3_0214310 [Trichomonas vaginalis G3]|nr:hypothetical protein TVAGG3_0214310 [Trichomonas vaginalis G3]KAI5551453.1 hypothetical protein TVAGG3_0214310 [Trichomonas vaginalis G3]
MAEITKMQEKIERILKDKEILTSKLQESTDKLEELRNTPPINEQEQINQLVNQGLKDFKAQSNEKLNKQLHKLMSDQAKKAAEEFAPHLQQLKTKHWADLSVLQTEHVKELERLKQKKCEDTRVFLAQFRDQFREQTNEMVKTSMKENNNAIERYRQKAEKELSLFNADLSSALRNLEFSINEIKRRYQRDIEIERNSTLRKIEEAKRSISSAKRVAEQRMTQLDNIKTENNFVAQNLPVVELEQKLNEKNNLIIQRRKESLENEVTELQNELDADFQLQVSQNKQKNERKIIKLKEDIDYLESEKNHMLQMYERLGSQRERAEKRKEISDEEIRHINSEISSLKDRLFTLSTNQPKPDLSSTKKSNEIISSLRREIKEVEIEQKRQTKEFEARISIMKERQEATLKKTGEKVKKLIEEKDKEIRELSENLNKANEMLIKASNAMKGNF